MAKIETLVEDIEKVLKDPHVLSKVSLERFGEDFGKVLTRQLLDDRKPHLSLSMIGSKCDRQMQYKLNPNIKGEVLDASTKFKFLYGDLIEQVVLLLAREAGHSVEGEQDELYICGVPGHRDAVIDGVLVDVKSASTRSFQKFKSHLSVGDDSFGYLDQLGAYLFASRDDRLVIDKHRAAFLAVDKQFGHICLDVHSFHLPDYKAIVEEKIKVATSKELAPRGHFDELDGKSGNRKLGTQCSYCQFKRTCWPSLSTYLYSSGPRYLTHVAREPDVPKA